MPRCASVLALLLVACGARSDLRGAGSGAGADPTAADAGLDGGVVRPRDAASPDGSERCNGEDDDGDGAVDEGILDLRCGRGACFASVPGCVDGEVSACAPGPPGEEICNEIDDDCDGLIDERLAGSRLSDPVVIRATGEATTGDCEVCDRAFGPTVLPVEDGLLALWQMDFLFSDPTANTFVRRLETTGEPREPIRSMFDTWTTFGMRATTIEGGRSFVTFCERFEDGTDHPASVLVDGSGTALGEPVVYEDEERCTTGVPPVAVRRGERHVVAYSLQAEMRPLRTVATDGAGQPLGPPTVLDLRSGGGVFDRSPIELFEVDDRILYVSTRAFGYMNDDGEPTGELNAFPLSGLVQETALVPFEAGYRIFGSRQIESGDPMFPTISYEVSETQTDFEGAVLREERVISDAGQLVTAGPVGREDALVVYQLPRSREGSTARTVIQQLAVDGTEAARWEVPVSEEPLWQDVRFVDNGGQKLIVYVVPTDGRNHTEVHLRRFGCEP
ncbi:MAG TPA: hypothetical protein RMH99_17620 [Sandaracinaceae bacterium LLY-WYZ-13_1]|nr:hypothetical protein [Sandaracinaceae bacterium LLY-WYZ-13_1]